MKLSQPLHCALMASLCGRSLIVFFAIYGGIVQNQNFSRFVRYNALQAILLDIILMCATPLLTQTILFRNN